MKHTVISYFNPSFALIETSETKFKVVKNDANVPKLDYYWKYPFSEFTTLTPYYPTTQNSNFHKHCKNVYGLSNEEIEDYIIPNYYKWLKDFMEAGKKRLSGDTLREANTTEVSNLKGENSALKELVAELSLENRVLKKNLNGDD